MVILDDEYHELLGGARSAHERSLKRDYKNRYFKTNGMLNLPALFIGITASIIAFRVSSGSTILIIAMIVLMVLVLIVFAIIMRRPTGLGRRLLDEVGGFKEYMEIAEKDEMNLRNPPHIRPRNCLSNTCHSRWRWVWNNSGANASRRSSRGSKGRTAAIINHPGTRDPGTILT
jgi:hypothetical protein